MLFKIKQPNKIKEILSCKYNFSSIIYIFPITNEEILNKSLFLMKVPEETILMKYIHLFKNQSEVKTTPIDNQINDVINIPSVSDIKYITSKFKVTSEKKLIFICNSSINLMETIKFWFVFRILFNFQGKISNFQSDIDSRLSIKAEDLSPVFDTKKTDLNLKIKENKRYKHFNYSIESKEKEILLDLKEVLLDFYEFSYENYKFHNDNLSELTNEATNTILNKKINNNIVLKTVIFISEDSSVDEILLNKRYITYKNKYFNSKNDQETEGKVSIFEIIIIPKASLLNVINENNQNVNKFLDYYLNMSDAYIDLKSSNISLKERRIYISSQFPDNSLMFFYLFHQKKDFSLIVDNDNLNKVFLLNWDLFKYVFFIRKSIENKNSNDLGLTSIAYKVIISLSSLLNKIGYVNEIDDYKIETIIESRLQSKIQIEKEEEIEYNKLEDYYLSDYEDDFVEKEREEREEKQVSEYLSEDVWYNLSQIRVYNEESIMKIRRKTSFKGFVI